MNPKDELTKLLNILSNSASWSRIGVTSQPGQFSLRKVSIYQASIRFNNTQGLPPWSFYKEILDMVERDQEKSSPPIDKLK